MKVLKPREMLLLSKRRLKNIKKKEMDSGITFPSMTRYGGEFPESEVETRTLTEYCRTHNILSAIAFQHTP